MTSPGSDHGPTDSSITAPGNAHKVLAVGSIDVASEVLDPSSGRGPTSDSRWKPDIIAPAGILSACKSSPSCLGMFYDSSAATAFAGGATGGILAFLRDNQSTVNPGQVYAFMIMSGNNRYFDNTMGAGLLNLPSFYTVGWGAVEVTAAQEVQIQVPAYGASSLDVAIWWPENESTHNDIDLYLSNPNGAQVDYSLTTLSVFEKVTAVATPDGTWNILVHGDSVTGTQTVYVAWGLR
jgi:serine protease AprX